MGMASSGAILNVEYPVVRLRLPCPLVAKLFGWYTNDRGGRFSRGYKSPVAGGQPSVAMAGLFGRTEVGADATLTRPGGELSGARSDTLTSIGDLYPMASLKWNRGVHNYMVYTMAGVPVGSYDKDRLSNLGINHWSLDAGGGYTYFDPTRGREFSAVLGFTYNLENPDTDYQNGVDFHLDWAASKFLSAQTHVGLVAYYYQQLTGDSGSGAVLGDLRSRVAGIGPQIGYFLDVGGRKWYANLKYYDEFWAENRAEGWNLWLTLAIPLGAAPDQPGGAPAPANGAAVTREGED